VFGNLSGGVGTIFSSIVPLLLGMEKESSFGMIVGAGIGL
jgi:hypothetical protein